MNVHKFYFSCIDNNLQTNRSKYEIICYDFETMSERVVVEKNLEFPKAFDNVTYLIP